MDLFSIDTKPVGEIVASEQPIVGYDYALVIPGNPRAQGRPRTRIVQPKLGIEELIRNIKVRIAFIGRPNEPTNEAGPDWSEEIKQMDAVLAASKKKAFPIIYETKEDKAHKAYIKEVVKKQAPKEPLDCPLRVDVFFYFRRPKQHYGTGRNANILKSSAPEFHDIKPDRDNLDKIVLDALTGIFWRNDSRVCLGLIGKAYSEKPRTEIYIKILKEDDLWD